MANTRLESTGRPGYRDDNRPVTGTLPMCERRPLFRRLLTALVMLLPSPGALHAADTPANLTDMSLEALMNIEVTSVSKKPEKQTAAAAAIYVISNADLRRWGVTTIPDALRRVPGLQVARIDANKWAITARGFDGRFSKKRG